LVKSAGDELLDKCLRLRLNIDSYVRAVCRLAFTEAGLRKLSATVTAGNAASKAVLEKAGFLQEGTLRESYFLAGRWQDDWIQPDGCHGCLAKTWRRWCASG
jgi:hypothetical protein